MLILNNQTSNVWAQTTNQLAIQFPSTQNYSQLCLLVVYKYVFQSLRLTLELVLLQLTPVLSLRKKSN